MTPNLTITLGDDEFELVPSLKAATAVSNRFSGFQNALTAIQAADMASISFVLRQGVGLKLISTDALNDAVWRLGTFKAMKPALQYVSRLANGGRDLNDDEDDVAAKDAEGDEGNGEV